MSEPLGTRIKNYLDEKGIKYSFIADRIGLPMNIFSPILHNKRELKATEYFAICRALKVPLEKFADQKGDKSEK